MGPIRLYRKMAFKPKMEAGWFFIPCHLAWKELLANHIPASFPISKSPKDFHTLLLYKSQQQQTYPKHLYGCIVWWSAPMYNSFIFILTHILCVPDYCIFSYKLPSQTVLYLCGSFINVFHSLSLSAAQYATVWNASLSYSISLLMGTEVLPKSSLHEPFGSGVYGKCFQVAFRGAGVLRNGTLNESSMGTALSMANGSPSGCASRQTCVPHSGSQSFTSLSAVNAVRFHHFCQ